ncbi:N-acetylneuraminate lyase-like [Limulus polyphemus]|uniref:N-acetylneuraminate lyase n=1 Tax=Limulus polyphemus TaxID=6850 RepID=A0ABM1ST95_LIMPO|nr:N-acetylneuraminate lyase-like [Limulus polyphemus]
MNEQIEMIKRFEGLLSAPFTAFFQNGKVNVDIIPKYVDLLCTNNVRGAFVNGTTGEGPSLTMEERKLTAEKWIIAGKGKLDLIVTQVGGCNINDAKELARHAEQHGATAIASLPPLYYKPTENRDLISYLAAIASAAPNTPFLYYHIPSYTGINVKLDQFLCEAKLRIPTLCGAKYTSTDLRDLFLCQQLEGKPFKLFLGADEIMLAALPLGVTAAIGATYNFMAPLSHKVIQAYKTCDFSEARQEQGRILKVVEVILKQGPLISMIKAVMNNIGPLDFGNPRPPLQPASEQEVTAMMKELRALKLENLVQE